MFEALHGVENNSNRKTSELVGRIMCKYLLGGVLALKMSRQYLLFQKLQYKLLRVQSKCCVPQIHSFRFHNCQVMC